ncbi:MAG TPA: hypothetical protein VL738_38505, partial [Dactylosporangium sp.]|nr:hypothetical protein [Dactylosporangium sp.]
MPQDHLFAEILDAFAQLEKWIPGCGTWPVDLMIGKLPDANPADIYRLADAWGEAATRLTDYYYDVQHSADPITDNWQGDGAPMAFNMAWNQHLQDVADVAQSMGAMQMIVQNYGLELETEEFFIAFTLITLLVQAIIAIVSAFFSGGISLGGLGAAYAAARIGIKEAFEACMRALVRLGEMLATGELKKVLSRTAIKDFLKVAGRDLAGRGAAALRNAPRALGTAVKDGVKELGPRRILARAAADRAAAQFRRDIMRSVLRKELRKQLMEVGTKAEAKAAIRALDKAAAELGQRMAADLRNQLFEKFAGRTAARLGGRELAHLGEHEAFRIAEHYGERGLANTTRGMLDTFIERQLERTTMLGTAGRYVGELAFAGAKFMGGVDFGAQAFELVTGERSSIDMQEVAFSLGQGALMGGGMFGHGVLGKMVTGGFAGVATAAATDGTQLAIATIKGEKADIHWGDDMWRGARDGVRMGLVFSAPHALAGAATHVVPHFGERPGGHQTFALNDSRLGTNVWTGDTRTGAGGYTSEHGGIGWRLADGSFVHLGSDGSVIASHRAGGEPTGGGPTRDGGGSRTSVIERPTPTRSVEGGGGPRSTERALPPGHGEGGADHTQTTHTSTDRTSTVDHTQTDRTSTDHTSTDRTTTDHTTTDHTSTDRTSTDHTSTDRTQNDRTQTDHTSTGDRSDHTQTDQTQTDRTQTDRTQTDHTGADRAQTDHAETTDRDHSQTTDRTQDGDRTDRTQTTDRTNDGDRTTDRANDGDRTQTTDRTQTVDRTQTEHRPAEQPRTEVRDEQVAARHPQATHERPPARTHAEEVLARVDDTRTPEALRAEQQTHLGEPEAGRPGHTVEHVERQMQDLAVQGRESTLDGHAEPSGPGPEARMPEHPDGGTHWVSAAGGHSADPHDFPRRLFGDVLDARVPGGLAGAEPHVVREHAHELAQQIMAADAGTRRIDTVQKLREYVRSELGVTDAAGTRVDRTRVDQAADRAAEHARNRGPETDRTAGERDRQREHEPEQQRDRGPEHEGRQRDHQPERERQQEHEGQRDHEGQREHDGQQHEQQTHEPVHTPGREPVEVRFAEDPVPREHTVERRFMVFDKASGHWRLVTERATMHWNEAVFDRLPLEHMEGGIDGPAARDAAHRAAQHLAEHEYSRLVDATDRWANGEGPVEDIGKIGGMSAAVVLHDGRIVAATSMRETTHQEFHDTGYTNREWEALGARRQAEIRGDFHSTRAEADAAVMRDQVGGPRHPLVLHELNEIPRQLRSLTHGKCAEPSTLSKVARMVEADFAREVEANGGHPRPGSREYDEALRQRFHDTVRDGQMASHRNEGEPIDRSEQLPCASDDQLLGRLGLRSDYVDHAIAQAHIDPERRLVILAEEGDLLRDYGMRLPDLGPDTVVVVMHGDVDGRSITARIGGMDATGAEVARVLNRIMAEHPEQFGGDRRIVLVTCEAGVEAANAGFRGQTTSLAEQVAERTGRTVIAARGEVLVSEHGGVDTRSHQPVPDHAVDSRPRFSEPQRPGWVEVTPTHDRHGNINGARTRDLTADEAPFREHADHPVEGHQVRADQPAHGPAHPPANSAIEGTRHVPEGTRLRLNEDTAYIIAAEETHPGDFGGGVRGLVRDNGMLRVDLAGERPHYFRVEVADGMHDVSVSTVHTGQPHDPHVIRISETT